MLNLEQIQQNYPENLRAFKKNILQEYLQYKILEIIFNSEFAPKLSFLGGTALRMMHGNNRFSEDLDFDNLGLKEKEFVALSEKIKTDLEKQGMEVETVNTAKNAYRCKIKLPKILFANELSALQGEKIMIQIDTAPHDFFYEPGKKILNKFDVFTSVFVTPADIILSQKIYAALNRKHAKGRDFYDIVFLLSFAKPNYDYLKAKISINSAEELKERLLSLSEEYNFKELAKDVEPFLFEPSDSRKVEMFLEFISQANLG